MFCAIIYLRVSLLTLCPTSGSLPLIVGLFYAKKRGRENLPRLDLDGTKMEYHLYHQIALALLVALVVQVSLAVAHPCR